VYKKITILIFYFISFSLLSAKADESNELLKSKNLEIAKTIVEKEEGSFFFLTCPPDKTETVTDACEKAVSWTEPTSTNPDVTDVTSTHSPGDLFPLGPTTVTYTGTDIDGVVLEQCSFVITVKLEVTANYIFPDDKCEGGDITKTPTVSCDRRVNWFEPSIPCPEIQLISSHDPGDLFPIGTTTVDYIAFYDGKILDQCSFTVTVVDEFPPVFDTCPTNITVDANEACAAVVTWDEPTASDNCGFEPTLTSDFPNGSIFPIGSTTVTYTATDEGGNTATCSFDVTVVDNTGPVFKNIPTEVRASANESCEATVTWDDILVEDNCTTNTMDIVVSSDAPLDDRFNLGQTLVTYSATDLAGNETIASFNVIVEDNTAPVNTFCPANITVFADNNCEALVNWDVPTFTDNCDSNPQIVASHNPGDTFLFGDTEVSYTATDQAGNETVCSFIVTVEDNTPPVIITQPGNLIVSANDDACEATVTWDAITAEDNCSNSVGIVSNFNSGDLFPLGETTVDITATDDSGNQTLSSFTVTVEDNTAPAVLSCPTDIRVSTTDNCDAIANWTVPTFSDNCDANPVITSTHNSGDVFPLGTTVVTYTATDSTGNQSTCSFNVIVEDDVAPQFTSCVADVVVTANAQCQATAEWTAPEVTDNCSDIITLSSDFSSGDLFPLGSTTVTYTATDEAGNSNTCSFEVLVEDNTAPVITTQLNDLVVSADDDACQATVSWNNVVAVDNCSNSLSLSSNFNSGDVFQLGESIVQITATDEAGNSSISSFTVTVEDNTAPVVVSCPADITVSARGNCLALVDWTLPEFSDNCDNNLTISSTHDPRQHYPLGTTLVTYTATDAAGNTSSCSFNVTVEDDQAPQFTTCVADIIVYADADCEATAEWTTPEVTDNCDTNVNLQSNFVSGDIFPFGTSTVVYTATDEAGNSNTCTFDVIVSDNSEPAVSFCPENVVLSANADCIAIAQWEEPVFEDCSNLTISSNFQLGDELPVGVTIIEYSATDVNGLSSICTFEVEVVDQTAPEVINCPQDISISLSENCESVVEWEAPTATDNCSSLSINSNYESGSTFPIGTTVIEYEFIDVAGNISTCSFEINVLDDSEILIDNCPEDITVKAENNAGTASISWEAPTATAECSGITVETSHEPGSTFEVGTTVVTYTFIKENNQSSSCSFEVLVEPLELDVKISRLLTPNGDSNNDSWLIEGIEKFPNNQVIIIDRWGTEIYSVKGYNNNEVVWKGENKSGELVARGTYYYFISIRNEQDGIERKGFLEVLR
jgi:gliding motility-associated-like protein